MEVLLVLLTIATFEEGDDEGRSWSPSEAQAAEPSSRSKHFIDPNQPTAVQIGRSYRQQLYVCRLDQGSQTVTQGSARVPSNVDHHGVGLPE
jgi:hypothetical protein